MEKCITVRLLDTIFLKNIKDFRKYSSLGSLKKESLPHKEEKLRLTDKKINQVVQDLLLIFLVSHTVKVLEETHLMKEKIVVMVIVTMMMKYFRDLIRLTKLKKKS